jgi:4'-phosphopantetheinyl transferase
MTIVLHRPTPGASTVPGTGVGERPCLPREGEIFLWLLDLPTLPLTPMLPFVTDAERGAHDRRTYRSDFDPWLKSRAALRCILSSVTGQAATRIAITTGDGGKPELAENPHGLHFNASRSKDYALIALSRAPLEVDIEAVRPEFNWRTIAMHWLHAREQTLLASAPEARRAEIFFQTWTHKEAYFKGVGTGLDREAMMACFTGPNSRSISGLRASRAGQWRLKALRVPPGYKASLASMGFAPTVVDCTGSFTRVSRLHPYEPAKDT